MGIHSWFKFIDWVVFQNHTEKRTPRQPVEKVCFGSTPPLGRLSRHITLPHKISLKSEKSFLPLLKFGCVV